jgi:hypothetical protein
LAIINTSQYTSSFLPHPKQTLKQEETIREKTQSLLTTTIAFASQVGLFIRPHSSHSAPAAQSLESEFEALSHAQLNMKRFHQ